MQYWIVLVLITALIFSGNAAYGAQLEAKILNDSSEIEPSFKFLRVVYIENLEGGQLAEHILSSSVKFSADSSTSNLDGLISQINESIRNSGSSATVTDVRVNYQAIISKQTKSATVEYSVEIVPTLTNHIDVDGTTVFVDSKWRGFQIDDPILVETTEYGMFDINDPASALKMISPQAYSLLKDVDVLTLPLIDASGILELPMSKWHYLFDPTAIQKSVQDMGYKGSLTSEYSMGECTIGIGICNDRKWTDAVSLDKQYAVRVVESRDDAVISIVGYTKLSPSSETIMVTLQRGSIDEEPGGFQTSVIYGMAGISAVAAGVFFVFSNRKIKHDKDAGQTGIDPARLRVQETSYSAGSYRTNRGESHLGTELANLPQKTFKTPV